MTIVIPDKTYFKIGEVAKLIGVKPYILRYWESEFKVLRPQKSRSRHRLYRRRDVEILLQIRHLLYEEKFTIAGAKQRIQELIQSGSFVPGKSGLAITESEVAELKDRDDEEEGVAEDEVEDEPEGDEAELIELSRQLSHARSLISELQEALTAATDGSIERELESLRDELAGSRDEIQSLREAEGAEIERLRSELEEVRERLDQASQPPEEEEADEAEDEARQLLEEEVASQRSELEALRTSSAQRISALEASNAELEGRVEHLGQRNAELESRNADLASSTRDELEALQRELDQARADESDALDALRDELQTARDALSATTLERDEAQAVSTALREELADVKDELATALEQADAQREELEAARARIEALEDELSVLENQPPGDGRVALVEEEKRELERKLQYQINFHSRTTRELRGQLLELIDFVQDF